VISGGGTGIGLAVARHFASEPARVVLVGRRRGVLETAANALTGEFPAATVATLAADLSKPEDAERLPAALAGVGAEVVEVLVAAAGGVDRSPVSTLAQVATVWTRDFHQNVLTAVLLVEALRARLARPGGRIVLVSSIAALRGGGDSYSAAKAALLGYATSLALELGPEGITVNTVVPGFVEGTEFFGESMTEPRRARLIARTALGRAGQPQDVAAAVAFLASEAAAYVSGAVLRVDGAAL
jgi:3-oxoacyl-[acyl-carrier protein] reductase